MKKIFAFISERALSVLLTSAALAVTLLSAIYHFGLSISGLSFDTSVSIAFSLLSLAAWMAFSALVIIKKQKFAAYFASVLWTVCFISFSGFLIASTTDIFNDSFFELIMMVFSVPAWSYMTIAELFETDSAIIKDIIIMLPSFAFALCNILASVKIIKAERTGSAK